MGRPAMARRKAYVASPSASRSSVYRLQMSLGLVVLLSLYLSGWRRNTNEETRKAYNDRTYPPGRFEVVPSWLVPYLQSRASPSVHKNQKRHDAQAYVRALQPCMPHACLPACLATGYGLSEEYPSGLRDLKLANKYVRLMRLIITCWHTQASAYVPVYSY